MSLSTSLDDLLGPETGSQQPQMGGMTSNQQPNMSNMPMQQQPQQGGMDNNQFVDAILTELEGMPEYGQDQNAARQQYSMNPDAHVPPPQLGDTAGLLKAQDTKLGNVINLTDKFADANGNKTGSFINRYKTELIATGLFIVLMFVLSLHQVNRLIFGFMPKLLLENGQISMLGILLKTVIAGLIFGLVIFFV
jgi:hypothetical protein